MSRPKQSNRDEEAFTWQPVGIAVGGLGVDLRTAPQNRQVEALAELTNATFADEQTIARRAGHTGFRLRDTGPASAQAGAGYTRERQVLLQAGHGASTPGKAIQDILSAMLRRSRLFRFAARRPTLPAIRGAPDRNRALPLSLQPFTATRRTA